ncbi:hypothetical protein LSH36_168g01020 [Paralvinella palmiformis]|uniref:Estradiol 17-beta-dehydrogenase 8 n=1 Tax=Paralvinella palmiformis TaxID=53620 RepID=A0AAD9JSU4_9ANNE|nr:hypothetical protein LSH36_168g01020 [Paralvinella palmiformis]
MASGGVLAGKLALVTGAGGGIGRAVCQLFAREGARLAVVDIKESKAKETLSSLEGVHHCFQADISSSSSVNELLKKITSNISGVPSLIVNCAGITRDSFLLKMEEKTFDDVININLKIGNLGQSNYAASKAGVIGLTKTAAKELAGFGIRCNVVLPGFIETSMTDCIPIKVIDMMVKQTPLGRMGQPEEVAEACLFLASDRSSYITGSAIEVTGGLAM